MSLLGDTSMDSPVQEHRVHVANDLQWITGTLETLGNPHNYVNQEGQDFLTVKDAQIAPWTFTALPTSQAPQILLQRANTQFLIFPGEDAQEQYREPPRTAEVILNLPLAILKGRVPMMSEAKVENFLDFWKGDFVPLTDASIYYLGEAPVELPEKADLLYVNSILLQSYVEA